jgi:hypothetical protein
MRNAHGDPPEQVGPLGKRVVITTTMMKVCSLMCLCYVAVHTFLANSRLNMNNWVLGRIRHC